MKSPGVTPPASVSPAEAVSCLSVLCWRGRLKERQASMAWTATIPALPAAIKALSKTLRPRAEAGWKAAHTLLDAIPAWEEWLNLARVQYLTKEKYDAGTGDEISRAGATAIRILCGLDLRGDTFSGQGEHLLQHWPGAPFDRLDATWYVWKVDRNVERMIGDQLFHSQDILRPAITALIDLLKTAPVSAFNREDDSAIEPDKDSRKRRKRKRREDAKRAERRAENRKRQERENTILREWNDDEWQDFGDYADYRNANLPEGWKELDKHEVKRAVDAARKRQSRKRKPSQKPPGK